MTSRRDLQVKTEIGEDAGEMTQESSSQNNSTPSYTQQQPKILDPMGEMQKKILEALNKKPSLTEKIAKKSVEKQAISKDTREELKASLMNNASIKAAMSALLKRT